MTVPRGDVASWRESLLLLAILAATAALRLRLLSVPLERDEGEFAYMGQLILDGQVPYVAAHNMKLPGVYYGYAVILALFGESDVGIRLGLLTLNLASIVLVYRLGRRLLDATAAVAAAAVYAVLSLSPAVLGFAAKGEHFVVPFVLGGVLLLCGGLGSRPDPERRAAPHSRVALAGFLLGIAFVMKQHAAVFIAFGGLVVLARRTRQALVDGVLFAGAAAAPFALVCLYMYVAGAFGPFWFWTFTYAGEYVSMITLELGLGELRRQASDIGGASIALWLLVALGLGAPLWDRDLRRSFAFLGAFTLFSALAVVPGLRFSEHYFVMLLPAASLLAGAAVSSLGRSAAPLSAIVGRVVAAGVLLLAVAFSLWQQRAFLFEQTPAEISRSVYGVNPFAEAVEIGGYLRQHAAPGDRLAVIGSEPEIYFYSGLRAATPYIYMYPLMEPHPFSRQMQEEMIAQLERDLPRYLVLVNVDTSWSRRPDSFTTLMEWAETTAAEHYRPVGLAEIVRGQPPAVRWGVEAVTAPSGSRSVVVILERRGG